MELNKYILDKAKQSGICPEWANLIGNSNSKKDLMQMYVKGIDFCLEHNFPSNSDLLKLGGFDFLSDFGVYVDHKSELKECDFLVLLGQCKIMAEWGGYTASQAYLKGTSALKAEVNGNAFLAIDCFDDSKLHLTASGDSKVLVNLYGNAKIKSSKMDNAIIKIIHKHKPTY